MRALQFRPCSICHRLKPSSDVVVSGNVCSKCHRRPDVLFNVSNGLDFGRVPEQLQDLTMIEEILIARVHPVVSVYKIRGQQSGYSGHVMNFVQHVEQVATVLPHNLRTLNTVILLNRTTANGVVQFKCRSAKVRAALIWLRANNQYYSDIEINEGLMSQLPADGDVSHLLPRISDEVEAQDDREPSNILEQSCYPNLPAIDANAIIAENLRRLTQNELDLGDWPDLSQ